MEQIRTLSREFAAGDRLELYIDNRSGSITVRGDDTTTVKLEVVARLWVDDDADADEQVNLIERGISFEGQRLTIRAPTLLRSGPLFFFGRGPRIDYQLTVPTRTDARIESRSGQVDVERIAGPLAVDSRSGRVAAREIAGDVTIASRSGSVRVEGIGGELRIESRSGSIRVSGCKESATVSARSGSMQIEDVAGDLKVSTSSGQIGLANAGGALSVRAASGAVRYEGGVHGPFDIDVATGALRLLLETDSRFYLDAESSVGSVRSDMPVRRGESSGSNDKAPTVRLRTKTGAIHIAPR